MCRVYSLAERLRVLITKSTSLEAVLRASAVLGHDDTVSMTAPGRNQSGKGTFPAISTFKLLQIYDFIPTTGRGSFPLSYVTDLHRRTLDWVGGREGTCFLPHRYLRALILKSTERSF